MVTYSFLFSCWNMRTENKSIGSIPDEIFEDTIDRTKINAADVSGVSGNGWSRPLL